MKKNMFVMSKWLTAAKNTLKSKKPVILPYKKSVQFAITNSQLAVYLWVNV